MVFSFSVLCRELKAGAGIRAGGARQTATGQPGEGGAGVLWHRGGRPSCFQQPASPGMVSLLPALLNTCTVSRVSGKLGVPFACNDKGVRGYL